MDCHLLSHGISVEKDSIHDCCLVRTSEYFGSPLILKFNKNNTVDWKELFRLKKELKLKKLNSEKDCKGCRALTEEENYDDDKDFIAFINLNHWNKCNSRCIYCSKSYFGGDKYFNVLPMMKSLAEEGYINNYGEVTFQGGEPTILPEFEDLLKLFSEQKIRVRIHSSGIKFSKAIETGLKEGLVTVVISPDTAKSETYEKIKQVKCFEKVWKNLELYAKAQQNPDNVKAKFIIIPGINDTIYEVDKFIEKSKEIGIKHIVWEVEGRYAGMYNYDVPNVTALINYAVSETVKNGLNYEFYDGAMYSIKNKKIETVKNKKTFADMYKKLQKEYLNRNLDYIALL